MFTKDFGVALLERMIKTFAQSLAAVLAASGVFNMFDIAWQDAVGVAGLATLLSILTTIGSGALTGNASLAPQSEVTAPGRHARPDGDRPVL